MKVNLFVDVPDLVYAGLARGTLQRVGGVIQHSRGTPRAGEIVMWLRDAGGVQSLGEMGKQLGTAAKLLQLAGSVSSVVNLGATLAFGIATQRKLARVDAKLGQLDGKLDAGFDAVLRSLAALSDRVDWSIDLSFAATTAILERMRGDEILAELRSASSLAADAQKEEPESAKRVQRYENAFAQANKALESARIVAERAMHATTETLICADGGSRARLELVSPEAIRAIESFRLMVLAAAVRHAIAAEVSLTGSAAVGADRDVLSMRTQLEALGKALVVGSTGSRPYDDLLSQGLRQRVPVSVVARLAKRFDPQMETVEDLFEFYREHATAPVIEPSVEMGRNLPGEALGFRVTSYRIAPNSPFHPIFGPSLLSGVAQRAVPSFLDGIEAAVEDVDRLAAHAAEYRLAARENLVLAKYREQLALDESPSTKNMRLLWLLRDDPDSD